MSKRNFKRCLEADKKTANLNFNNKSSLLNQTANCEYFDVSQDQDPTNVCNPLTAQTTMYPSLLDNLNHSHELTTACLTNSPIEPISSEKITLKDKLRQLICDYHISHNCVNKLLEILRSEGLDLPKDVRTLFQTPKNHSIINVHPGTYIHIGIEFMITPILLAHVEQLKNTTDIHLGINIDGLPISRSSKSNLWPILISIVNIPILSKYVMPVGIYYARFKKPESIFEYLDSFMTEMKSIISNGLCLNGKIYNFVISQIICDAPAKAFMLNVKSFNAYHSCNYCIEEGTFINGRMSFLGVSSPLRTDDSFRSKKDEDYHKGSSPLEDFSINIVSTVVIDYMHSVCLGVMKRLLTFWVKGKKPIRFKSAEIVSDISSQLIDMKPYIPSEFNRLPRSLDELEFFKATEFRTFLLYTSLIVLKGRLAKPIFQHFMLFHCAIKILISNDLYITHNSIAKSLLISFVSQYLTLYGYEYVTYNVHGLIHLADFALQHGPLDKFSAFKYENCLQIIKKTVKNARYPLQDVYNRVVEFQNVQIKTVPNYPILNNEIGYDPIYHRDPTVTLYEQVIIDKFVVSRNNIRNKYFILDNNEIVQIQKIGKRQDGSIFLEVIKYNNLTIMFETPILSSVVGSFYVDLTSVSNSFFINLINLKHKCIFIPVSDTKAVVSIVLHS